MARPRLTIVGLGLIGGSLGLALRAAGARWEIVGHNRRHEVAGRALKLGAIDRAEWNLPSAVAGAEVVVIAVAPLAVEKTLEDIAPHLAPGVVVTDVTSTKSDVLAWAERLLPASAHFVGGHPMAGKESAGIDAADAALFRGATYCILPGNGCATEAVTLVEEIVKLVGARPFYLDAAEHDSYVAAVSHVPFIAAAALVTTAAESPAWHDVQRLAAGGFRDGTRTASADVAMHRDICLTNSAAIERWLSAYIDHLVRVRDLIGLPASDQEMRSELEEFFLRAKNARDEWLAGRDESPASQSLPPLPRRDTSAESLLGRWRPPDRGATSRDKTG